MINSARAESDAMNGRVVGGAEGRLAEHSGDCGPGLGRGEALVMSDGEGGGYDDDMSMRKRRAGEAGRESV